MKSMFSSLEGFFFLFLDQSLQKVRTNYNIPKSNLITSQYERPKLFKSNLSVLFLLCRVSVLN